MTVYRSSGRGSYIVERVLLGIAVRRATGVYEVERAREVEDTLMKLASHGRRAPIEAFVRGQISGAELVSAVEKYGMSFEFTIERARLLAPAVRDWLAAADLAPKTIKDYRNALAKLQRRVPRATVSDLPVLLARAARAAKPAMFRHMKTAAQSLVSDTVPKGQHSDLWRDVAAVEGRRAKRRDVQGGLPPEVCRRVAERLAKYGPMWWTMYCYGMGPKEYWLPWKAATDRVYLRGVQKGRMAEPRDRVLPRTATPVRPLCAEQRFRKELAEVGRVLGIPKLTPYVARRSFAHLLELAKIEDSRCDAYMGHAPKGMRGLYREHDVEPYLSADAAALRETLGADPMYLRAVAS